MEDPVSSKIPKWRGIPTTSIKKNELEAKTITNRLKQKSMSLPRIDDKKRWAGFPGLAGWAEKIATIIPDFDYYIEPFAGSAKVFQELMTIKHNFSGMVLNDKSYFVYQWLEKEFGDKVMAVTRKDFIDCIKMWDGSRAFFLLDMPWNKSFYDQDFSCFDRYSVKEYDEQVLELCHKMEGSFIITTRKENMRMIHSTFNKYLVKSIYPVSGHYPLLLLTTNLNLDGNKQILKFKEKK